MSPKKRSDALRAFWRGLDVKAIASALNEPRSSVEQALFTRVRG